MTKQQRQAIELLAAVSRAADRVAGTAGRYPNTTSFLVDEKELTDLWNALEELTELDAPDGEDDLDASSVAEAVALGAVDILTVDEIKLIRYAVERQRDNYCNTLRLRNSMRPETAEHFEKIVGSCDELLAKLPKLSEGV